MEFYIQTKNVDAYPSPGITISSSYDYKGEKKSISTIKQDQDGRLTEYITEFSDPATAKYLNSVKTYSYENQKLTKVVENDLEVVTVDYDKEIIPLSMTINAGFINMSMQRVKIDKGYRYDASMVPGDDEEGLLGMMGEMMADLPKSYVLYEVKNQNQYFTYIEEDKESGEITSSETYIRNMDGQLVESIESKIIDSHKKYKYSKSGDVIEIEDVTNGTVKANSLDDNDNIISKYEDYYYYEMEYDENNEMVKQIQFIDSEEKSIMNLIVREIFYK